MVVRPCRCRNWCSRRAVAAGRPRCLDAGAIGGEQPQQALGCVDALGGGFRHAAEEKFDPGFPGAVFAHRL